MRGRPSVVSSPSLLRHPDFVRLWTAETVGQLGTQVSALAIPFVAIEILRASTFEVALLNVVDFLPFLLIGLPAGVWVDRLRRRPVMIAGDIGRAAALATIPLAYLAGVLTVIQLYAVGFVVGILTVFFDIAYQSYLPSVVARDQLQEGNAKLEISRAGAQVVGPGLAGILIGIVRAPFAVALDALSFLGSALFLFLIRRPEPPPRRHDREAGPRPGMRREIAEGLRYVVGHPYLRSIAACTATSNLFGTASGAVLLVYLVREMGMTADAIGLAFSIGATGALLGALSSPTASRGAWAWAPRSSFSPRSPGRRSCRSRRRRSARRWRPSSASSPSTASPRACRPSSTTSPRSACGRRSPRPGCRAA